MVVITISIKDIFELFFLVVAFVIVMLIVACVAESNLREKFDKKKENE